MQKELYLKLTNLKTLFVAIWYKYNKERMKYLS